MLLPLPLLVSIIKILSGVIYHKTFLWLSGYGNHKIGGICVCAAESGEKFFRRCLIGITYQFFFRPDLRRISFFGYAYTL